MINIKVSVDSVYDGQIIEVAHLPRIAEHVRLDANTYKVLMVTYEVGNPIPMVKLHDIQKPRLS